MTTAADLLHDEKSAAIIGDVVWRYHVYNQYGEIRKALKALTRRIPGHPLEIYKEAFEQDLRLLIVTIEAIHEAPKQPNPKNKFADASDVDIDHVMGKLRAVFPDETDEYLSGHIGMVIYWFYLR